MFNKKLKWSIECLENNLSTTRDHLYKLYEYLGLDVENKTTVFKKKKRKK